MAAGTRGRRGPAVAAEEHGQISLVLDAQDRAYHAGSVPAVPDSEHDAAVGRLREIERENPGIEPRPNVGAPPPPGARTVRHAVPMGSLDNAYAPDELERFADDCAAAGAAGLVAELKYDGLSLSLRYEGRRLASAATRGSGETGEDVTANAAEVGGIPATLPDHAPDLVEVRDEVVMPRAAFATLNEEAVAAGRAPYANPRAAAAGSLRQRDAAKLRGRGLVFVAYGWGEWEGVGDHATHRGAMAAIASWGVRHDGPVPGDADTPEGRAAVVAWGGAAREGLPFDVDGIVFKVDDLATRRVMGQTARTPRWAVAWKFAAARAETVLEGIELQVGRTGAITPVARLRPVPVGGVTVASATLHNEAYVAGVSQSGEAIRVGGDIRVGDTVVVERAGDVIPKVAGLVPGLRPEGATPWVPPTACPRCGAPAERDLNPDGTASSTRRCTAALTCPAQARAALVHFASRGALDVQGLGEALVDQLMAAGIATRPSDLFTMVARSRDALAALDGMGATKLANLARAIDGARSPDLRRFLFALGIRQCGEGTAKRLATRFGTAEAMVEAARRPDAMATFEAVEDVGPVVARSVVGFLTAPASAEELARLLAEVRPVPEPARRGAATLAGETIVFTGTLVATTREEAEARAEALGARTSSGVSRKTTLLVAGPGAGSKLGKATGLGVRVIDEAAWTALSGTPAEEVGDDAPET